MHFVGFPHSRPFLRRVLFSLFSEYSLDIECSGGFLFVLTISILLTLIYSPSVFRAKSYII